MQLSGLLANRELLRNEGRIPSDDLMIELLFIRSSGIAALQDMDLTRLSLTNVAETDGPSSSGLGAELERFKQEILAEVRKEIGEMKMDLIKGMFKAGIRYRLKPRTFASLRLFVETLVVVAAIRQELGSRR